MVSTNDNSLRTYPGWDSSYKSCLCLLLAFLTLSLLLLLVALFVPGKSRHPESSPKMPKNFDPELYAKLLQEYRARTRVEQTTQKTTQSSSTANSTIETIPFQPIKRWSRTPTKSTTIKAITIPSYTTAQRLPLSTKQYPELHTAKSTLKYSKFYTVQGISGNSKSASGYPAPSTKHDIQKIFYNNNTENVQEYFDKSTQSYSTTFSNATDESVDGEIIQHTRNHDTSEISNVTTISRDSPNSVDGPTTARTRKSMDSTELIPATKTTTPSSLFVLSSYSLKDSSFNSPDDQVSLEYATNQVDDDVNVPQEHNIEEDYKPVSGQHIFQQKTIIKEKIIEKDCPKPPKVCSTDVCKRSASEMLALMDHSIDPCDDFYWYACNGLMIHRMEDRNDDRILLDKIKDFLPDNDFTVKFKKLYDSCSNFKDESYSYLRNYTEHIFNDEKYNRLSKIEALTELITTLLMLSPSASNSRLMPIFDLTVDVDITGSFIPMLTLPTESSLIVALNSIDSNEEKCLRKIEAKTLEKKTASIIHQTYIDCLNDIGPYIINLNTTLYSLGVLDLLPKLNRSQKIIDIEQGVQFDVFEVLGSVTKRSREEEFQSQRAPIYFDIEQMQTEYPQINWKTLLSNLFKDRVQSIKQIRVLFKETIDKIFAFFEDNKFDDIKNLLMAMFLHDLHNDIKSVEYKSEDENFCLKLSTALMEDIAAKILTSKINKNDLKYADEYITNVFEKIKVKFDEFLQSSKWLTDDQKQILCNKLSKIKINANALNLYFNEGILSYRNSELHLSKNFAENLIKLKINKRHLMYEKITNNPGNVWTYLYNPMGIEIFPVLLRDEIVIPIGLLSKYAVKKRSYLQDYEIYAKLGFKISKAILQFFTPTSLDKLLPGLRENEDFKNFMEIELADPPVTKFENVFGITVTKEDIKLTAEDRFSDDGALRLVFETFFNISSIRNHPLIWLNVPISQIFYTSFAQEYCVNVPNSYRVASTISQNTKLHPYFRINSVLMNSAHFAETFNCRIGSSMNPEFKVNQFPHIEQSDLDYDKNQEIAETF